MTDNSIPLVLDYIRKLGPGILQLENIRSLDHVAVLSGNYNVNHVIKANDRKFVVRINIVEDSEYPVNKIQEEYLVLKYLSGQGIAPEVYHYDAFPGGLGRSLLIEEFLEGTHVNGLHDVEAFARLFGNLHKNQFEERGFFSHPERKTYSLVNDFNLYCVQKWDNIKESSTAYSAQMNSLAGLIEEVRKFIAGSEELFKSIYIFSLTHNDPDPLNFLRTPYGIRMIDFEFGHIGVKEREIGDFFLKWNMKPNQQKRFFKEYLPYFGSDPDIVPRVGVKYIYNAACRAVWSMDRLIRIEKGLIPPEFTNKKEQVFEYLKHDIGVLRERFN